ncbi:ABC transporter substrate-binding protein [Mesobacterium pallidum]|uniref:ABC transporter substrate-binding protein n=1 Tax=Mesobacterium pallidum TaxID=2872037 RepID=UPI001EE23807|nr:extracellular solute-binding protein [Mesobacterium pallidum]
MKTTLLAGAAGLALLATSALADCAFENDIPLTSLSPAFQAWKSVTDAMAECGNFQAELDQDFRTKQPVAFAANPSLYAIGGISNGTITPLLAEGTIRPLDDLVEKYGQHLKPNQLIRIDGQIMAIAMMLNTQEMTFRKDILDELGLAVPTTWDEVMETAEAIRAEGKAEYPLGQMTMAGWNLALEFINMYASSGLPFYGDDSSPAINNEVGLATLEAIKAYTAYMDPEYLVSDSTYVQKQFQQGTVALSNLWASRAGALDNEAESQVVGLVDTAAAPFAPFGDRPAATLWWDGMVIAKNISDEAAEAAFRLMMEGMDTEMVTANNDDAIWLIDGYQPGRLAKGAIATATTDPAPLMYPTSPEMAMMHSAIGNVIADFLTGARDAQSTLDAIEADYMTAAKEAGLLQ